MLHPNPETIGADNLTFDAAHRYAVTENDFSPRGDLRTLPWLAVQGADGQRTVGLDEFFKNAHSWTALVHDGFEKAALIRFLTGVAALLAREEGLTRRNADAISKSGFKPETVDAVLGRYADRLYLVHPDTPFFQDARLSDIAQAVFTSQLKTSRNASYLDVTKHASQLIPAVQGDSAKAWWGLPGSEFVPTELTDAEAARALIVYHYYGAQSNNALGPFSSTAGTIGTRPMAATTPDNQMFWTGETVIRTLLANLTGSWISDGTLPTWAGRDFRARDQRPASGTLEEATSSGLSALLVSRDSEGFARVFMAGALPNDITTYLDGAAAETNIAREIYDAMVADGKEPEKAVKAVQALRAIIATWEEKTKGYVIYRRDSAVETAIKAGRGLDEGELAAIEEAAKADILAALQARNSKFSIGAKKSDTLGSGSKEKPLHAAAEHAEYFEHLRSVTRQTYEYREANRRRRDGVVKAARSGDTRRIYTVDKKGVTHQFTKFAPAQTQYRNLLAWFEGELEFSYGNTLGILLNSPGGEAGLTLSVFSVTGKSTTGNTDAAPNVAWLDFGDIDVLADDTEASITKAMRSLTKTVEENITATAENMGRLLYPNRGTSRLTPAARDFADRVLDRFYADADASIRQRIAATLDHVPSADDTKALVAQWRGIRNRAVLAEVARYTGATELIKITKALQSAGITPMAGDPMKTLSEEQTSLIGQTIARKDDGAYISALRNSADKSTEHLAYRYTASSKLTTGGVRAIGLLARHRRLRHNSDTSLGQALGRLDRSTKSSSQNTDSALAIRIQSLPATSNVEEAARVIDGLLARLEAGNASVSWFSVVDTLNRWGNPRVRQGVIFDFYRN